MTDCSGCGAALTDDGYPHTEDCRIGRATRRAAELTRTRELIESSSLGEPGPKALRKLGWLTSTGMSDDEAMARLTPAERKAARDHMDELTRRFSRRAPRSLGRGR